ncbi:unnamed protein product [Musa acuminata var. zebrina]
MCCPACMSSSAFKSFLYVHVLPPKPLAQFVKELKFVFPNSTRMNRGVQVYGLIVCHLSFAPTAYFGLLNVVTMHDIMNKNVVGTMSEAYPHLILDNFTSKVCLIFLFLCSLIYLLKGVCCLVGGTFMSYLLFFIIKLGTMCGNGKTSESG